MPVRDLRPALRRRLRRHRRALAAVLAALAVLVGLSAVGGSGNAAAPAVVDDPTALHAGEVAVPVTLASAAIGAALAVGDVVDVVSVTGEQAATARVVAARARVVDVPASGFAGPTSSAVVLAVVERDALALIAASAQGALSVLIRSD